MKQRWLDDEIKYIKDNYENMTCAEMATNIGRTTKSIQHMFNKLGLKRRSAQVGDIIKGWEIKEIYIKDLGSQNVRMARVVSTFGDGKEAHYRLTKLTLGQVGYPDGRRPDLTEKNTTHGESETRLYRIWSGMKNRCSNIKTKAYPDYGGRGINIYDKWLDFIVFRDWANSNGYNNSLTIDRIDVDDNYEPDNCRWVTRSEQVDNKRNSSSIELTAFGETKSVYKWSRDTRCSVKPCVLIYRYNTGWKHEDAIVKPPQRKTKEPLLEWLQRKYSNIYQEWLLE